jgi:hypothetical protein
VPIQAAEIKNVQSGTAVPTVTKTQSQVQPATRQIFFPENGWYSYNGLAVGNQVYSSSLLVTLKYDETSNLGATVTVPGQDQPIVTQEPSPITASLLKTIYPQGNAYQVNLEMTLKKQQASRIFLSDFSLENKTYLSVQLDGQSLECKTNGQVIQGNTIDFKDEQVVRCSKLIDDQQGSYSENHLFSATMMYGVMLQKTYPFSINLKEQ